ncbi:hypothetical protein [Microbacterium sp. ZXX196]|uniref:hypothetical protein n=1 Tax=Microbacterium sp. ZXX196 TaxID=2609291 RepID=UPI0012B98FC4|nr:hypothetical protein [Microbacterium sp. ZXX196]MTE22661.1 hypothetical protein [Microbacterium sp. ZXX196]
MTSTISNPRDVLDQFTDPDEYSAAEDALLEDTGRAYADAWSEYESARSRLMTSLVYEQGSVAATDRVAHHDLTGEERAELVERRIRAAQFAWSTFQEAERAYVLVVNDEVPVEIRQP